ncbi:MAG TPA: hypothetical protein DCE41_31045 [Cytophagales bacterium]|nr:hypothetical protein [Cytophagales bacterium]HAA22683.1 hypothetical protein [Cytophagales bacterium]HAP65084.1 hypothetical protein [Cytophagales bacterium]
MYKYLTLFFTLLPVLSSFAQQDSTETFEEKVGRQIFLPSLQIGYIFNQANNLTSGIIINTSLEYRVRNNNDIFFRANYDTYNSDYIITPGNALTNVIEGTASFTDLLIGSGYRFGDSQYRIYLMAQAGVKLYNFPEFVQENNTISIVQGQRNIFSTRATVGFEYYINEKSAFSLDILQSQVWRSQDFWIDNGSALGFTLGYITSLY